MLFSKSQHFLSNEILIECTHISSQQAVCIETFRKKKGGLVEHSLFIRIEQSFTKKYSRDDGNGQEQEKRVSEAERAGWHH